ncbi:uncharacterized protein LOC131684558 [Topomyia yanbarensis]|uniref:uncharacterized protein LOC131684558 n=1 Tax=Topomyia yanbarensis TaxID=2498891 RepID=UPI00273ADF8A|nr:uncharacterized protein LOC131684558 [Topomyia yanbarensis]
MLRRSSVQALSTLIRRFSNISLREYPKACSSIALKTTSRLPVDPVCSSTTPHKLVFLPREIYLDVGQSPVVNPLLPLKEIIDVPRIKWIIENPNMSRIVEIGDSAKVNSNMELPTNNNPVGNNGIQAARLIVIRRRKMRKHKLRKLRKKMKFEWAKVRQRRELRKEKAFQAGLIGQIKEAEKFSAEAYVASKLRQATETPIPRFWKGKRLPQFIIKQKMGIE